MQDLLKLTIGEDSLLILVFDAPGSITSYTLTFSVTDYIGDSILFHVTSGIVVLDPGPEEASVSVSIPSATTSTMSAQYYRWELWRSDSGFQTRLAHGLLLVNLNIGP